MIFYLRLYNNIIYKAKRRKTGVFSGFFYRITKIFTELYICTNKNRSNYGKKIEKVQLYLRVPDPYCDSLFKIMNDSSPT